MRPSMFNEAEISGRSGATRMPGSWGMVYPKDESPWMQFVEKIHQNWTHYKEMGQANELMEKIKAWPEFEKAADELCYFMQFRQRGILYRFQTECILKPLSKSTHGGASLSFRSPSCF